MKVMLPIIYLAMIFLFSCKSETSAKIFYDDKNKCQGNEVGGNDVKSVFIVNTSKNKAYTFTIRKKIMTTDDSTKSTTQNDFIELQPGEEKYLGCTALMQSRYYYNASGQISYESKELRFKYEVVGQVEVK